jgi:hypothetical protein
VFFQVFMMMFQLILPISIADLGPIPPECPKVGHASSLGVAPHAMDN